MIPATLKNNPVLARWVTFHPDRTATIRFGKVEIGQGNGTALAQVGAEELDLQMDQVRIAEPETGIAPDEGLTIGSMSLEWSGASIRAACAEIRQLFLAEAAKRLSCSADALSIGRGVILREGRETGLDYWSLAPDVDLDRAPSEDVKTKDPKDYSVVGRDHARFDLPSKVFGATFVNDMLPEDVVHARVLHQPGPDAKFVALDEAAVKKAAGGEVTIFREGEFLAFLSPVERVAEAALARAEAIAQWENAPDIPASASEAEYLASLPATVTEWGAPPAAPSNAKKISATYSRPYLSHGSLGPSCGVAKMDNGKLTLWTHAQGVYPIRANMARVFRIPITDITVIHGLHAGNYGHNAADDASFDAAFLALRHPGKTIRVQWRREDEFAFEPVTTAVRMTLSAEVDAEGKLVDYTNEILAGPAVSRGTALIESALPWGIEPAPPITFMQGIPFTGPTFNSVPSYDVPVARVKLAQVKPPVRVSSLRGLGGPPNEFATECFVDELAREAGTDPYDYRMAMLSDPRGRAVLERAADMANWRARPKGGEGHGFGIAQVRHRGRGGYFAVVCEVEVETEVQLKNFWCAVDCGLVVSPDGVKSQVEGGLIMGASWAIREQVKLEGDGIRSRTWGDYPILRFNEVPAVHIALIDRPHLPSQGVGEISSGPAMAAVGNAVADALGVRLRDLPFTRERIADALLKG